MKRIDTFTMVGIIFAPIGALFLVIGILISSSLYYKGGNVTINGVYTYCPPGEFNIAIGMFLGIFGGLGLIFFILGMILLINGLKRSKAIKQLLEEGKQITATITDIERNQSVRVNGRHPYIVYCEYEDAYSGKIHVFRSDNVMDNPGDVIGQSIPVMVDRDNWDLYYVDTNSLTSRYEYH